MTRPPSRPASKKSPGTSGDVAALSAGKVELARLHADVAHAVASRPGFRVVTAGGKIEAAPGALALGCGPGARTIGWKALTALSSRQPTLLVFARPVPQRIMTAALDLVETMPRMEVCFLEYVVWLPGGAKNPSVDWLNARINAALRLSLTGYILDPEGRPGVIVGRH